MKDYNNTFTKLMEQYAGESPYTREELEDLIADLSAMVKNPALKLTKDEVIAKLKGYINQLNDTPENRRDMEYLAGGEEPVMESKKKAKKDNCYRKAKAKYDVFPSAYASGYISKCRKRKGKIK
jgi:cytochrome c556